MIDNQKLGCWGKQQLMTELHNTRKRRNSKAAMKMAKTCSESIMNNITTWNGIEMFFSHKNGCDCFRKKMLSQN